MKPTFKKWRSLLRAAVVLAVVALAALLALACGISIPFTSFKPIQGYSDGNGETRLDPSTLTNFELLVQEPSTTAEAGVPYDLCAYGISFN